MHDTIAAFLTIKLNVSFVRPLAPKSATNAASQLLELSQFAVSEMELHGAIRTNLVLDVAQAILPIESQTRAKAFEAARAILYGFQRKLISLHDGDIRRHIWAGFAVGAVLFDDEVLFGDAVTESVFFSEAAFRSNAVMVASSDLIPDSIGGYRLSKINGREVVVIDEFNEPMTK